MLEIEEIFKSLNKAGVRYILIGGLASILHGVPRTTVDVDITIFPKKDDVEKTIEALRNIGLIPDTANIDEILGMGGTTFTNDWEVDVLTSLPEKISFESIYERSMVVSYKGVQITTISIHDQIELLKTTSRHKDIEDIRCLEEFVKKD